MTNYNSGGINAIRGFNFQNSVAAYLLVSNLNDESFVLLLESKEDIEIRSCSRVFHIQVKSNKIYPKDVKIKDVSNSKDKSILMKLLDNSTDVSVNKLVCRDYSNNISLQPTESGNIFSKRDILFKFDENIVDPNYKDENIRDALSRTYLIKMDKLTIDSKDNTNYIVGYFSDYLANENIPMSNDRTRQIVYSINELIKYSSDMGTKTTRELDAKTISTTELHKLINNNKTTENYINQLDEFLNILKINPLDKVKIKTAYQSTSNLETLFGYDEVKKILEEARAFDNFNNFTVKLFEESLEYVKGMILDSFSLKAMVLHILIMKTVEKSVDNIDRMAENVGY